MTTQTLTIQDLSVLRTAIELAATRGAFRAEEMRSVGECFEKLTVFLNAMSQQNQPAPEAPAPSAPEAESMPANDPPDQFTQGEFQ